MIHHSLRESCLPFADDHPVCVCVCVCVCNNEYIMITQCSILHAWVAGDVHRHTSASWYHGDEWWSMRGLNFKLTPLAIFQKLCGVRKGK